MCLWHKRQVLIGEMISPKKFGKRDYFYILVETSMLFEISMHILFIPSNPVFYTYFNAEDLSAESLQQVAGATRSATVTWSLLVASTWP